MLANILVIAYCPLSVARAIVQATLALVEFFFFIARTKGQALILSVYVSYRCLTLPNVRSLSLAGERLALPAMPELPTCKQTQVMRDCWVDEPFKRPTMAAVLHSRVLCRVHARGGGGGGGGGHTYMYTHTHAGAACAAQHRAAAE